VFPGNFLFSRGVFPEGIGPAKERKGLVMGVNREKNPGGTGGGAPTKIPGRGGQKPQRKIVPRAGTEICRQKVSVGEQKDRPRKAGSCFGREEPGL